MEEKIRELEKRLDKLEERNRDLEKENEELKKEVYGYKKNKSTSESSSEDKGVSRRGFLKGLGALGVGALAASSPVASRMTVSSNTIEKDGTDIWQGGLFNTDNYLALDGSNAMTGNLSLEGNSLETGGGNISIYDTSNSRNLLKINEGGPVEITDSNLRLSAGNVIEDENGAGRISIRSEDTLVKGSSDSTSFGANYGGKTWLGAYSSQPVGIKDQEGGFYGVHYRSSSSTPGTLELTNAKLEMNSNNITNVNQINGQDASSLGVPSGVITMWSGAITDIPSGWVLCDGNNGTPDLRNRFIVGAGDQYTVDGTGGQSEVTLTENEIPSHNHQLSGESNSNGNSYVSIGEDQSGADYDYTQNAGGDQPHENRPPYYALAYIMKE